MKLILCFFFSFSILANIANPYITPMGEEESFMSNTGVANHQSLGSFFYNPGALSSIERTSFTLSGALYSYYGYRLDTAATVGDSKGSLEGSGFSAIPGTLIISKKTEKGIIAFGVLRPSDFKTETKENWSGSNSVIGGNTTAEGILRSESYEVWMGVSYSRKVSKKIGLGASIFGFNHYDYATGYVDQSFEDDATKTRTSNTRQLVDSYGVLAILGVYYRERNYALGLSFKTPSLTLYDKAEYYKSTTDNTSGTVVNTKIDLKDIETGFYRPADLSFGYSADYSDKYTFSADVSIQMPVKFNYLKTNDVANETRVETKLTPRFNAGLEVNHSDSFKSMYGLGYNPSTIKSQSNNRMNSEADGYLFTGGFIMTENNLSTGIGFSLFYGEGLSKFAGSSTDAKLKIYNGGVQILTGYNF
jgi:hypothetical protein